MYANGPWFIYNCESCFEAFSQPKVFLTVLSSQYFILLWDERGQERKIFKMSELGETR